MAEWGQCDQAELTAASSRPWTKARTRIDELTEHELQTLTQGVQVFHRRYWLYLQRLRGAEEVQRLVDDFATWGCTDVALKTDGEPSRVALQKAMAASRRRETIPVQPPAYPPESNGTAERAAQEFSS